MKRIAEIVFAVAIAAAALLIAYVKLSDSADTASGEPVKLRAIEAGAQASDAEGSDPQPDRLASSNIPLAEGETLLDLYSFNLDFDEEEEQILVTLYAADQSGTIRIVVADYSPYTRRWTRSWEGDTLVTKVKTFQVSVSDLIGDHNLDIVCTGMNDTNDQTMTIYWKTRDSTQRQGPSFAKIFEQAGNAVVIVATERPESYKLGQSNAESYPVQVWRVDAQSGNYLDQLRETWQWSFSAKAYVIASTERIAGASIAQKMAESILDGNEATFKGFLDGTWYKETFDPLSREALFITFQSRDDLVMFSGEGLIEVFEWENSNPTRYGLYIAARNQSVRNLRRLMDIELASTDTVNVRVFQDYRIKADIAGTWDGRYRKVSQEMAKSFKRSPAMAEPSALELSGSYSGADGSSLSLDGRSFILGTGGSVTRGTWSAFSLSGKTILDVREEGKPGASGRRSWIVSVDTRKERNGDLTRTLTLREVRIGIGGIEEIQVPPLVLTGR